MNNNNRNYIDVVLVIALIALGGFLFNRIQNLSSTQAELAHAQADITQVSDMASTYAEEGTALAETSAADAATAAYEFGNANATATQSANDSAAALDSANTVGTQAAADSAETLDNANATATQSANDSAAALDSANATATQAADNALAEAADAATQQAVAQEANEELTANLGAAEVTLDAMVQQQATERAELDNLENEVATLSTAQAAAEEMASVQMTTIADLTLALDRANEKGDTLVAAISDAEATIAAQVDVIDSLQVTPANNAVVGGTPPQTTVKGLVLFQTDTIEIYLPADYVTIDPADGIDAAMIVLRGLGPEYEDAAIALEQNPEFYLLWAARSELTSDGFVEGVNIAHVDTIISVSLETFMDIGFQGLPEEMVITEQEIIELNGQEVLRTEVDFDLGYVTVKEVVYVYAIGSHIYLITFATSEADYEERKGLFENIAATFTVRD